MGRTKKFIYNSVSTALYQLTVMIVGIITPRILLKCYGSELNGLVSSINQFITYFSLVEAGIAGAAVYSLYKPLAEEDSKLISRVVSTAKKFYYKAGCIFTLLVVILAIVYPFIISTNSLDKTMISILIIALGAKGFLEFFTLAKYRVLLTADQKTYIISLASTIYVVVQMIIVIVLANLRMNIVWVYTLSIIALLIRTFILMFYVKIKYKNITFNEKEDKTLLNKRWDALFLQILGAIQTGVPVLIATFLISLKDVSVYTVYNMVFTGLAGVLGIFTSGLSASFGDVIVRGDKKLLNKTYNEFEYLYFILITIIYLVTSVMLMPFIKIYTEGIDDINYILPICGILFVINGYVYNLKTPQGMLIVAAGMYKETRIQNIIQASIIIVLGIILAPFWGISGILIASILANFYRLIDQGIFVPKYILKVSSKKFYSRIVFFACIFIIGMICTYFININVENYLYWALYSLLVLMVISLIIIVLSYIFDKEEMKNLFNRVKNFKK